MTCKNCGAESEGKFCISCGSPLEDAPVKQTCANCGSEFEGNFCAMCGTPVTQQPESGSAPSYQPAPQPAPPSAAPVSENPPLNGPPQFNMGGWQQMPPQQMPGAVPPPAGENNAGQTDAWQQPGNVYGSNAWTQADQQAILQNQKKKKRTVLLIAGIAALVLVAVIVLVSVLSNKPSGPVTMENFKQVAQANSFTVYEEGQDEEFFLYGDFSGVTIEEAAVAAWDQSLLEISFVKCDSPQGAEKIYDNALDSLMSYASDEEYRQISEEGYQITYTLETDDEGNYINLLDEGVLLVDDCIFMISNYTLSDEEQDIQSMPSIEAFFNDLKIPLQLSE